MSTYTSDFTFPSHPASIASNADWHFGGEMYSTAAWNEQDWLVGINASDIQDALRCLVQWQQSNTIDPTTPCLAPDFNTASELNQGWEQTQPFPQAGTSFDNDLGIGQTDTWSNVNGSFAAPTESPPTIPEVPSNDLCGIAPSFHDALGRTNHWSNVDGFFVAPTEFPPAILEADSNFVYGIPPSANDALEQTGLWFNINGTIPVPAESPPIIIEGPSNVTYDVHAPIYDVLDIHAGNAYQQAAPPSSFSFPLDACPMVPMPAATNASDPTESLAPVDVSPPQASRAKGKRKRADNEDMPQTSQRTTKRRATVRQSRVNKTLPINNSTTRNRASENSVLVRDEVPDAVSSQTAGSSGSPTKGVAQPGDGSEGNNEVGEISVSAHKGIQSRATAALKEDEGDKRWHCTMESCNKSFGREKDAKRHILGTKGHRHPKDEAEYVCEHCGRKFGRSDARRRHQTTKTCEVLRKMEEAAPGV
ncbi:hypothetical protein EW146_g7103 [Bondarzewia mesenterica]|uniref:C2H2-type domain-containing protein n=1 Tax=Bondarzewia mesenterica TaxID=1095465 RepID=A0A4S4LLQ1_9AGAM|nr:hypothetical protein EW146_g7103 [Bondarzewia mesenterica]